jgi:hypothetical protein
MSEDLPIRIRIWNECKRRGMKDDDAYREIRRRLGEEERRCG